MKSKTGFLLINLGTPDSTKVSDVRRYLREFLSDPRVIDIAAWKRWLVLNLFILPFRPKESAHAYSSIWMEEGSPLLIYTQRLADKVQEILGEETVVEIAMRYGSPSIESALDKFNVAGVDRIVVFPLYPQYASATIGSSLEKLFEVAKARWNFPYFLTIPPFYDHPAFIEAFAEHARPTLNNNDIDRVVFSFHGLPERHVQKSDVTYDAKTGRCNHCLMTENCCDKIINANRHCYRAHCVATARALGDKLGIPEEKRVICFQSRLGRNPWVKPYTDLILEELAGQGVKNIAVFSPAFVADCLETLEELGIRGKEDWQKAGGEAFHLIACPNDSDTWAKGVVDIAREHAEL